jgi:hypothetical protein
MRIFAGHARWKVHPVLPTSFEDLRWLWNREKHRRVKSRRVV